MLRFAPSPTADMNIGDLRIAIFNYILSKQLNKNLLIRIEDLDTKKNIEGKDKEILEMLNLFSIEYTQVVNQSENIKYHTQMAMKLLLDKNAFNCFCSDEALEQDKEIAKKENKPYSYSGFCETISDEAKFNCNAPFVVRIKRPEQYLKFTDLIKGEVRAEPHEVDSFIILNKEKTPTYNFACSIDDMLSNITTVIRDEIHLLDTPKQIYVREVLGYNQEIDYIHLPALINKETEKKVSNTDDKLSIKNLIDEGFLPAAIANYLVLLGYDTPKEIFTLEEAIEWFDIKQLSKAPVEFDIDKLRSINKEHLRMMDDLRLSKLLGYADTDFGKLAKLYINECSTIKELKNKFEMMFAKKSSLENFETQTEIIKSCMETAPFIDNIDDLISYITDKTGLKDENLLTPLRYLLTGSKNGIDLSEIYPLIKNYLGEIIK